MRQFIRHPAGIPIEIVSTQGDEQTAESVPGPAVDIGLGGLAFEFFRALDPGSVLMVRIPCVRPVFESPARVAWCLLSATGYRVGVQFLDARDEFRARMVEQVCHIESYRKRVLEHEHRELSADEAALEWILKYAAEFPHPVGGDMQ
jgi:hypothetical protein